MLLKFSLRLGSRNRINHKLITMTSHHPILLSQKQLLGGTLPCQTCLKKLVTVRVAGLKLLRLQASSPLVVLSRERLPTMLELRRSDHDPLRSAKHNSQKESKIKQEKLQSKSLLWFPAGVLGKENSFLQSSRGNDGMR